MLFLGGSWFLVFADTNIRLYHTYVGVCMMRVQSDYPFLCGQNVSVNLFLQD